MVNRNSYLKEVFKRPPITARQPNMRNLLVRAKFPKNGNATRKLKGMSKCGKGCPACPFIREGKVVKINNKKLKPNNKFDCNAYNIVYAVTCKKEYYICNQSYIGETK